MKMLFKLFLLLSVAACGLAQNNDNADYWQDLYDSQWYDEEIEKLGLDSFEWDNSKDIDGPQSNNKNDGVEELGHDEKNVDEEISNFGESQESNQSEESNIANDILNQELKEFISQNGTQSEIENEKSVDENGNDYVLEDNRLVSEEKIDVEDNLTDEKFEDLKEDVVDLPKNSDLDKIDDYVIEDSRLLSKDEFESLDDLTVHNKNNEDVENVESMFNEPFFNKSQEQESGGIVNPIINTNEQDSNNEKSEVDMDEDKSLQDAQEEIGAKQQDSDILKETKQLLENIESSFANSDEDNIDKVNDDLDYDLKKLFETFDKLSQNAQDEIQKPLFEVDKPEAVHNEIADYEEKFQRPYNEEAILKLRQDYEESINNPDYWDDYQNSNENKHKDESDAQKDEQSDLSIDEILKKLDEELEKDADDDIVRDEKVYENDALHANEDVNETGDSIEKQAIRDSASNEDEFESKKSAYIPTEKYTEVHSNLVEELTSAELKSKIDELMNTYADELDVDADGFDRNVAPVHITLKLDEPVEITSPDYPNFYPTNNIIDWIFEGDGMGIELNITDLSLNGFMGDYLLIKPGGLDHTGQDGLVFSFHLNSERRYRFLDVDRMFVRFRAHPGMQFARGFKFSVKLVGPKLTLPEPVPTPTPAPELPEETLTVFFEGLVVGEFRNRSEEFRSIIADMATLYINRHGIDPGYEPT
ncbi:hypothetical protein EVAR_101883_1 [Eumeta japonica]|uniref:CUB domain-containing protein n=1 Tax=Eumeta variegata TaxID=151549 RepID=A0A4C1SN96_EUMVA|nr:hypothetical protein EVAR_101883_1 [Eumeta japonica]